MIIRTVLAFALLGLTGAAAPAPEFRMTLAEARQSSAEAFAVQLLGPAGASQHFVEADVHGNGGIMIAMPGLNSIDLYRRPEKAGALCKVEGITITFDYSRPDEGADPPHAVRDFYKFTRFVLHTDRPCSEMGPVAGHRDPRYFTVSSDGMGLSGKANFAMQAVAKARRGADALRGAIHCTADRADPKDSRCSDPAGAVRDFPIGEIRSVEVERCPKAPQFYCVDATFTASESGNESRQVTLTITTDARHYDPPGAFAVTGLAIKAETWVYD